MAEYEYDLISNQRELDPLDCRDISPILSALSHDGEECEVRANRKTKLSFRG
jgi:hypothetical protein